jgi:hypothetical protein
LAQQFGQAIGRYGALRDALGETDKKTRKWKPKEPDPLEIQRITEPHHRGAILVAAIFDAFLTIYKRRIADLLRIATGGSGVLPAGELHPDLVNRLAQEASKTSRHVLQMSIRAFDYCPPVDVDFGDYLRALITADADLVADDRYNYRLAIIEAFRQRGIYPRDVRNLSEESLLWKAPDEKDQAEFKKLFGNGKLWTLVPDWGLTTDRKDIFEQAKKSRIMLHRWFVNAAARKAVRASHIVLDRRAPEAFFRDRKGVPALEVHSARPARRIGPDGQTVTELVVEMTQRRRGYLDPDRQKEADRGEKNPPKPDFLFRGGCTLLIDPDTAEVRYVVHKRITSGNRLERMRRFLAGDVGPSLRATYLGDPRRTFFQELTSGRGLREGFAKEPFALLHRSYENKEVI